MTTLKNVWSSLHNFSDSIQYASTSFSSQLDVDAQTTSNVKADIGPHFSTRKNHSGYQLFEELMFMAKLVLTGLSTPSTPLLSHVHKNSSPASQTALNGRHLLISANWKMSSYLLYPSRLHDEVLYRGLRCQRACFVGTSSQARWVRPALVELSQFRTVTKGPLHTQSRHSFPSSLFFSIVTQQSSSKKN